MPGRTFIERAAEQTYREIVQPIEAERDRLASENKALRRQIKRLYKVAKVFARELDARDKARTEANH